MAATIASLQALRVSLKLITGYDVHVATHLAKLVGLTPERLMTSRELATLHDEARWQRAEHIDVFAEIEPSQKERIILALKKMITWWGHGRRHQRRARAPRRVAREAADFVLLQSSLAMLPRA